MIAWSKNLPALSINDHRFLAIFLSFLDKRIEMRSDGYWRDSRSPRVLVNHSSVTLRQTGHYQHWRHLPRDFPCRRYRSLPVGSSVHGGNGRQSRLVTAFWSHSHIWNMTLIVNEFSSDPAIHLWVVDPIG